MVHIFAIKSPAMPLGSSVKDCDVHRPAGQRRVSRETGMIMIILVQSLYSISPFSLLTPGKIMKCHGVLQEERVLFRYEH